MMIVTGLIAAAMIGFALSPLLALTLCLYLVIDALRDVQSPLHTAWVNQKSDSETRATIHSMSGQVDSIGQIAGGSSGLIARYLSVTAAIMFSGLLLMPAMGLVSRANSQSKNEAVEDSAET
ncbi:MAG: hypothetical protein ACK40V_01620 [Anaerolineales bacterium]